METDTGARTGEVDETDRLISSQKVDGTAVYNHEGENLGTVDHLMIDKFSGQVAYAVMSFGGFLGIGSSYHPLPWNALNYDVNLGGYRVGVNRAHLEAAPRYTASTEPNWSDRAYTDRVDQHWAVSRQSADSGVSSQRADRIVAVFDSAEKARAARNALTSAGISNDRMEIVEHRTNTDNWTTLRNYSIPDEDCHLYAEGLGRGHAMLLIRCDAAEHDRLLQLIKNQNPIDIDEHASKWRAAGWSGRAEGAQEQVIPVYEEKLKVGKRVVEQGGVRVRVYTVEQPVQEGVTLRQERVAVERRPVDRPVGTAPGDAFRDRTIDVQTRQEEAVVGKEARVKEEVVVRKEADQRTETVRDKVRRTEVDVDDDRAKVTNPAVRPKP
jgi:uncharacterized protein (TIGR02271 family)